MSKINLTELEDKNVEELSNDELALLAGGSVKTATELMHYKLLKVKKGPASADRLPHDPAESRF
jgi:hypothetical protein